MNSKAWILTSWSQSVIQPLKNVPSGWEKGESVHHSFPDPALTDDMDDFRKVRDEIEKVMIELLNIIFLIWRHL